jgi:DNA-binding CsgD family transcriptional regulator
MASRFEGLLSLVDALKRSRDFSAFRANVMDGLPGIIPANVWGMYILDGNRRPTDVASRNVRNAFLTRYEEVGRKEDPVLNEVFATHLPCHNLQRMSAEQWHSSPLFQYVTARLGGFDHVLEAPLVGEGRVIGTLNLGRCRDDKPFDDADLAIATALSHHLSVALARLPEADAQVPAFTERELEIARLVASGLNNREIADCLSVSRNTVKAALKTIFSKAHVDARAELVARLATAGLLD